MKSGIFFAVAISFLGLLGCNNSNETYIATQRLALRESPSPKSKALSDIMIGEQVAWLDKKSSENNDYMKIKLSDKKEGWALKKFLLPIAQIGISQGDVRIYKRPQANTVLPNYLPKYRVILFDMAKAIDSFVPITSMYGTSLGWILKSNIGNSVSTNKNDIIVMLNILSKGLIKYNNNSFTITDISQLNTLNQELQDRGISSDIISTMITIMNASIELEMPAAVPMNEEN